MDTHTKITKEMFSQFCHDLRTPLTVMKINIDLLKMAASQKLDKAKLLDFIKSMNKEIDHLVSTLSKAEEK